jgi:hypothetical protein
MIITVCVVASLILFGLAAVGARSGRINLVAAGLFFWALAQSWPVLARLWR